MPSKRGDSSISEVSPKKRIKSLQNERKAEAVESPYEIAVSFEEKESQMRTVEEDSALFHKTCEKIKCLMNEMQMLKKDQPNCSGRRAELRCQVGLAVLTLKKLNRLEKLRLVSSRERTSQSKLKVDAFHLTLQNLLYALMHVKKEVGRCLEFKSLDEQIDLVPWQQCVRDAPDHIIHANGGSQSSEPRDEHNVHLVRLNWELEVRQRLAGSCNELNEKQIVISHDIDQQHKRLASLAPRLSAVLKSTELLQKELAVPVSERRDQLTLAAHLPAPLYTLFVQLLAHSEAHGHLEVSVRGDQDEAMTVNYNMREKNFPSTSVAGGDKKTILQTMLQTHPLEVSATLSCTDCGELVLNFAHWIRLDIVSVSCRLDNCPVSGSVLSCGELLDQLICEAHDEDMGRFPAVEERLRAHQLPSLRQLLQAGHLNSCRPFTWLQQLAGYQHPSSTTAAACGSDVARVLAAVRDRLADRVQLQTIISQLEKRQLPSPPLDGATYEPWWRSCCVARLVTWSQLSREQVVAHTSNLPSAFHNECDVIGDVTPTAQRANHMFHYLAVVQRGATALMRCYISISVHHPRVIPVFSIIMEMNGVKMDARTFPLREVECEVNVDLPARLLSRAGSCMRGWLLAAQLQWLCSALDVIVDAASETTPTASTVFHKLPLRGPERLPPLYFSWRDDSFSHRRPHTSTNPL